MGAVSLALLLGACTTQSPFFMPEGAIKPTSSLQQNSSEIDALRQISLLQDRLDRVVAPLLTSSPDLCKKQARNLLGLTAKNRYSYSVPLADAAQQLFGLDERLQVASVMPNSGAARLGIQRGDILIAADDHPIPQGVNAETETVALLAPIVAGKTSVKLTIQRKEKEMNLTVPLTRACGFRVDIGNTDSINSYADGRRILITRGMVRYAQTDDELAYVVAKEMAHNVLGHARMLKMTGTVSEIIDNLVRIQPDMSTMVGTAGVKPMSQQYDIAADALSLQMVARAGYNIDQAVPFWQRLAAQHPATELDSYTALHPASDARLAAMSKAVARIKTAAKKRPASAE